MHPSRHSRERGVTLIEMIVAIVVVAIVLAATVFFAYPLREAVDTTVRADLTDTADNALQRITREVRLALPNSVRVAANGGSSFIEFIPVRIAGRYRSESSGAACDTATDELAFDVVDTCFKTLDSMPPADIGTVTVNDFLVLNNYGEGFDGQNAYATSGTLNVRKVAAVTDETVHQMVRFTSATALDRTLHDSPGRRFYIVPGNGSAPSPVTYECTPPALLRRSGYTMTATQPKQSSDFSGGSSAPLAGNVAGCDFAYQPSAVGVGIGLLTLRITLSKPVSSGGQETVTLYQSVHVNNVP
jgi:MSHA biogenesis protein MshO